MKIKIYADSIEASRMAFDLCNMTVLKGTDFEHPANGYGVIVEIKTIEERFALERVIQFLLDHDKNFDIEEAKDYVN